MELTSSTVSSIDENQIDPRNPRSGVEAVPYDAIISSLMAMGAKQIANSGGHNLERYELPGGRVVSMSNSARRIRVMHHWMFRRFLGEVETAGANADIFMALCHKYGMSWARPQPWIEHLTMIINQHEPSFDLAIKSEQDRLLKIAAEHYDDVVPAAALYLFPQVEIEVEPEPEPKTYTLVEAIDLALQDDDPAIRKLYYSRIKANIYSKTGRAYQVLKEFLIPAPAGQRKLPRLPEEGLFALATHIEEAEAVRIAELPQPEPEELPAAAATTTEDEQENTVTEVSTDMDERAALASSVPTERRYQATAAMASGYNAPKRDEAGWNPGTLLTACNKLEIEPKFQGFSIDVEGTLWAIAQRVNTQNPS